MITKKGISASPGVAIGQALVLDTEEYRIPRRTIDSAQVAAQVRVLDDALAASRDEVEQLRTAAARRLGEKAAEIFAFHAALISDDQLRRNVVALIENRRLNAAYAFGSEMNRRQREFQHVNNAYLKERVHDLYDIEKRVLRHILGREREDISRLSEPVVIVAHDVTPSQVLLFDRERILGIAVNVGGSTSHTAIIAQMLGIPAVVGLNDITSDIAGGETIIIDGRHGIVACNPDSDTIDRYRRTQRENRATQARLRTLRDLPAVTLDGVDIQLLANIELADEARDALELGAQGIGLYRTEFLFLANGFAPTEKAHYDAYLKAVRLLGRKKIVIRSLDLGADKIAAHLATHAEHNPDLGLRSIRYCLQHLDLFKSHLRAILRAAAEGDVRIMFPLVTTLMELRQARGTVADVMEDLEEDGVPFARRLPIGMMVETPAAAMQSAVFAREVDFMSIGTNDLTQYTLAVDRSNERVAHLYAAHNPAVLRLIRDVVRAGRRSGVSVNICGQMAGDPAYCELLLGMGMRQLSMPPKDIPEIKRIIRSTTIERCQQIARKVLRFDADRQVINYLREKLRELTEGGEEERATEGAETDDPEGNIARGGVA